MLLPAQLRQPAAGVCHAVAVRQDGGAERDNLHRRVEGRDKQG